MIRYIIIHNFCFTFDTLTDSLKKMNNDSRGQEIYFKTICKLFSLFQLCSEKLSDWLKDLRWIMIPEDKEISFEALQIKLL